MNDRSPGYRDVAPVRDLVSEEEAAEVMVWLDNTPHEYAVAHAAVDLHVALVRRVEADGAKASTASSNERKLWDARTSSAWREAIFSLRDAQERWKEIEFRAKVAFIKIDLFRTICANKRAREAQESDNQRAAQRSY